MKIVASIEARMGSSRLPGKTMKKILGRPMLELMIERVQDSKEIDDIVIATSSSKSDDVIQELTSKLDVNCFRGSTKLPGGRSTSSGPSSPTSSS